MAWLCLSRTPLDRFLAIAALFGCACPIGCRLTYRYVGISRAAARPCRWKQHRGSAPQVLAVPSLGTEISLLGPVARWFGLGGDFDTALAMMTQGKSVAAACLGRLDEVLPGHADTGSDALRDVAAFS
jgi:hypothetical protein